MGSTCLLAGPPIDFGSEQHTLDYERFDKLFSETLSNHGFTPVAKSRDLFEVEGRGLAPNFLFGAVIRPKSVDICDSFNGY